MIHTLDPHPSTFSSGYGGASPLIALALSWAVSEPTGCRLQSLSLNYCRLGGLGACFLAQALKTNVSLQTINLYDARIDAVGFIALAEAALQNTSLQVLKLSNN